MRETNARRLTELQSTFADVLAINTGDCFNRALTQRFYALASSLDLEGVLLSVLPQAPLQTLSQLLRGQPSQDLKVVLLSTVFLREIPDFMFGQYPILQDICGRRCDSGGRFLETLERLFQPKSLAKRSPAQKDALAFLALLTASIIAYGCPSIDPLSSEVMSIRAKSLEACRFHLTAALLHYSVTVRHGRGQQASDEGDEGRWRHAGLWVAVFRSITLHAGM